MVRYLARQEAFGGLFFDRATHEYLTVDEETWSYFEDLAHADPTEWAEKDPDFMETCTSMEFVHQGQLNYQIIETGQSGSSLSAPVKVFIEVTSDCNLRCSHCFNESGDHQHSQMTAEEIKALLDEMASVGVFEVKFTGGEPFVRSDFMDILNHAVARGLVVTLATNGTLITDDVAEQLKNMGLKAVRVSLDGPERIHNEIRGAGSFKRALRGFQLLQEKGVKVGFNLIINGLNFSHLEETLDVCYEHGAKSFNIGTIKPAGRALDNPQLLEQPVRFMRSLEALDVAKYAGMKVNVPFLPSKADPNCQGDGELFITTFGCIAGQATCNVDSFGDVSPCGVLSADHREYVGGNIRTSTLLSIWTDSTPFREMRALAGNDQCLNCRFFSKTCNGGCRARALALTGDINRSDPFCLEVCR